MEKSIQIIEVCASGEVRCNRGICVESEQPQASVLPWRYIALSVSMAACALLSLSAFIL